jgi:two-component system, response regulator RegA
MSGSKATANESRRLLLVDDNVSFRRTLAKALLRRGWHVDDVGDPLAALAMAADRIHRHAVLDLNLAGESGLELITQLLTVNPVMRIVMLTGYASIATATEAIRRGAMHYLAKPTEADEILAAFERTRGDPDVVLPTMPMSVNQLEWEHLQRTLLLHEGNVSAAARSLRMHRRTLQRKLQKHACW